MPWRRTSSDSSSASRNDFYRWLLTEIETGLRWGELIALREWHVDFLRRTITVEETIVEVSKKHSPTGERYIVKSYPKDDEPRVLGVRPHLLDELAAQIERLNLGRDDLLFPSTETAGGTPLSRNTFRTRYWGPPSPRPGSEFTCACMISAMPTHRGSWPEAPISRR